MPDLFTNRAFLSVTESAAGTLTFDQLNTGISTFSKQAFIIHRIQWYFTNWVALVDSDDYVQAALVTSNKMSGLGLDDPSVVQMRQWHAAKFGTPANHALYSVPINDEFAALPGGGLIIPANPVFLAIEGSSIAAAQTVSARIDFTVKELKADEYIELVEALRMTE